jgi:hypothetical protein
MKKASTVLALFMARHYIFFIDSVVTARFSICQHLAKAIIRHTFPKFSTFTESLPLHETLALFYSASARVKMRLL